MSFVEWSVRVAIKFVALGAAIVAVLGVCVMGVTEISIALMARHYTIAVFDGIAVLSGLAGSCPLALAIDRYALKALGWAPLDAPRRVNARS